MQYTPKPPEPQPAPDFLVTNSPRDGYRYFSTCQHAQTMIAYSLTHSCQILFVLPCRTWSCPYCANQKIKRLACIVQTACPNRLMTLTTDPALYENPKHAWQQTRKQVPILIRRLRLKFGEVEYLRVTELTRAGWPHYHLLVRSGYLPHAVVKAFWQQQSGARIVDLRQVKKSFSAYTYLVKYLAKMHDLQWTERHVSTSRNFGLPQPSEPAQPIQHAEGEFLNCHPTYVVLERCQGMTLQRLSNNAHLILPKNP